MSLCALVGASEFNRDHFQKQAFDCVIAVDGGYASLQDCSVEPNAVVGDFDSLGYVPHASDVHVHPCEKDQSDMELAMDMALGQGHRDLYVYGALAGRLDHTLANIQLMVSFAKRGARVCGVGRDFLVLTLDGARGEALRISGFDPAALDDGAYGRFISIFAFGGTAHGVCVSGLKYNLEGHSLHDGVSLGLSNEFSGKEARISLEEGSLVVICSSGAWPYLRFE